MSAEEAATRTMGLASRRVAAIDGLRGLLAVVVLAWHALGPLGITWLLPPAYAAVWGFFALSGYVLTRGWRGPPVVFLARRFVRLWPVFALCLGFGFMVAGRPPVWSEFVWYPLIGPNSQPLIDPPIWSLFIEAWTMPIFPLIVWGGSGSMGRFAVCLAAMLAAALLFPIPQVRTVLLFGPVFIGGAWFAHLEVRSGLLEAPAVQWLGQVSYSLYLSHWIVLRLATRLLGPWGGVAALPVVFLTAWLIWWAVERPSITLSRAAGRALGRALDRFHRSAKPQQSL